MIFLDSMDAGKTTTESLFIVCRSNETKNLLLVSLTLTIASIGTPSDAQSITAYKYAFIFFLASFKALTFAVVCPIFNL